jgi:SAM-dependent methyltransferase|mmetsp:Transcript_119919/g.187302  ORF Transcript_119919/g.187302 Transcript_119919/m.187302 type:complete len:341 (+) Transcript_119919:49-1071(+)
MATMNFAKRFAPLSGSVLRSGTRLASIDKGMRVAVPLGLASETRSLRHFSSDPSQKWKEITVEMWRDAVYTNETYFGELIADTNEFVKNLAEQMKLSGRRVSLVEVGCGTGEFIRAAAPDFRTVVGVDFNKEFIDFCRKHDKPSKARSHRYIQGDATQLREVLRTEFPETAQPGRTGTEFWGDARVVACVGNTIGIIPEELRPQVYKQMADVAGANGVVVMVYWNARWFGDACLNFYHANPNLCGPFEGNCVDFKNTTLETPMKYKTKWTSSEEARALFEDMGMEIISLREKGKGVIVAARRSTTASDIPYVAQREDVVNPIPSLPFDQLNVSKPVRAFA